MAKHFFTSESVTEGHPDKVCDRVSDAVLDALLAEDPESRVACETVCTTGMCMVMGEISTKANVDIPSVIRTAICETGFNSPDAGFDGNTCAVLCTLDKQSPDIDMGVSRSLETKSGEEDEYNLNGAGDQGMMFGYACDETPELMPLPISLSHALARKLAAVRKEGVVDYLRPDGKTQVTVEYDGNRPVRVDAIVLSTQHNDSVTQEKLREDMIKFVILPTVPENLIDDNTKFFINPTGRFVVGGPAGDSGLTGRKIIVDTYGGYACHGGGAFSGKDPTKVDRSAAYAARYAAKNIVASGIASKCQVELAYAIGVARPVSVLVDTFGTGKYPDEKISDAVSKVFDLRPAAIIDKLDLKRPIYKSLSSYGQVGRTDLDLSWERTDRTEALLKEIEK